MKQLAKDDLFKNLSLFLKSRGIEITDGSYARGIRQSCELLTDAINLGQESVTKAREELDKSYRQIKQVIHEKTAPKTPPVPPSAAPKAEAEQPAAAAAKPKQARSTPKRKDRKSYTKETKVTKKDRS